MNLAISIVTYKTNPDQLGICIDCIFNSGVQADVYIVDNSPDEELKDLVLAKRCIYIHNPSNPGYGAGHNIAIKNAIQQGVDYHLVINADVSFPTDALGKMIAFMEENPHIGQLMPMVINPDGTVQRLCKLVPTPFDLFIRRFLPASINTHLRRQFELWESGYNKVMFVPYLSGCFMFLRCTALKEVGLFDERFFMYPEDIDLTRRMAMKYDTVFFPNVTVTHEHGAASYKSLRMLWVHAHNLIKYFNKWGWFFDNGRRDLNRKTLSMLAEGNQK